MSVAPLGDATRIGTSQKKLPTSMHSNQNVEYATSWRVLVRYKGGETKDQVQHSIDRDAGKRHHSDSQILADAVARHNAPTVRRSRCCRPSLAKP